MKTITIEINEDSVNVINIGEITRQDFKYTLEALIEKFGNQPGIKRTLNEKLAAKKEVEDSKIKQDKLDKTQI
jgi:hypothetical protein